jgi:hypothetical protein
LNLRPLDYESSVLPLNYPGSKDSPSRGELQQRRASFPYSTLGVGSSRYFFDFAPPLRVDPAVFLPAEVGVFPPPFLAPLSPLAPE